MICLPFTFLVHRLRYCGKNIIPHFYCEHMGIARLACDNIRVNIIYGLTVALLSTGLDIVFIIMSYPGSFAQCFRYLPGLPDSRPSTHVLPTSVSSLCSMPQHSFHFFAHRFGGATIPHHVHILVANLYVVVPPMLNPIIYGVKTKQIHDQVFSFTPAPPHVVKMRINA